MTRELLAVFVGCTLVACGSDGGASPDETGGESTSTGTSSGTTTSSSTSTTGGTTGGSESTGTSGGSESSAGDEAPRQDVGMAADMGPLLRDCPLDLGETAMVDGMFGVNPLMGRHAWYGEVIPKVGPAMVRILVVPTVDSGVAVIMGGEPEGWALVVEIDQADLQTDTPIDPASMLLVTGALAFPLTGTVDLDAIVPGESLGGSLVGDAAEAHVEGPFTAAWCLAYSVYAP